MSQLTVVQMNDTHAYLDLHPELFYQPSGFVYRPAGGYARIATLLRQIRSERPGEVLFIDGGDTFHGTYPAVESKGRALLPVLNALKPDAMTAHWEFAYSPAGFEELTSELTYPMLATNVYWKEGHENIFPRHRLMEIAGLRVGIVGIASNIVDKTMPPKFSEGAYFTDGRVELEEEVRLLREQARADLVVLDSHLGFPQDMQLMKDVPGVDIDLSAHTHHRLEHAVRRGTALVTQSGSHGSFLTRLDLTVEGGKITDYAHHLLEVSADIEPDSEVQGLVQTALQPYRAQLDEVVGETRVPLDRGRILESSMDNLLLAAILEQTEAEVAFSNGWRFGAPILPGPIRADDLYNMAPMDPPVSTVDLTGEELWTMLEENLEHTFSSDPFQQMGGYVKRCMGIRVYFKIENPAGHRIHKIFVGAEELRPEKTYHAGFITEQGVPAHFGRNRQQHPERLIHVLRAYLRKHSPLELGLLGTFTAI